MHRWLYREGIIYCCEYYEGSIEEIIANYNIDVSDADGDEDEIKTIVEEYLQDNTSVCGQVSGGSVYAAFWGADNATSHKTIDCIGVYTGMLGVYFDSRVKSVGFDCVVFIL